MQTPTRGPKDHVPVAPRASKPPRREQDLIVIPEAIEPRRWGIIATIVAGVLALVLIAALTAYAIDQRNRADDLDTQLTETLDDRQVLLEASTVARERIVSLETRIATLEGDLQRARQGRSVAAASRQETREQLRQARSTLAEERALFRSYMGPPIGDGTPVGKLISVGADQAPARVTIDIGRWFTGSAATQAAIADGVIVAGETVPRYFRNNGTTWRTLPLDTLASVSLLRRGGPGTVSISLAELQRLSRADSRRADRIFNDPFQLTVVDGRVTALRQLRYP